MVNPDRFYEITNLANNVKESEGITLAVPDGMVPRTNAEIALVLSISGLMLFSVCTAIPGLLLANGALATTMQFPNHPEHGVARAAQIIAWISIALFVLVLLLIMALIILGIIVMPAIGFGQP